MAAVPHRLAFVEFPVLVPFPLVERIIDEDHEPCPDQPFEATITILNLNGKEVARVESDAKGHFLIDLEPGTYTLRPGPGEGIAHASEQSVTVSGGQFTRVVVSYDSGIR